MGRIMGSHHALHKDALRVLMGIEVDPKKTDAVNSWPRPITPSDNISFLCLAGYNNRFVEGFSSIASLLMALTQNKAKFEWSEGCEKNFQELKDRLTSTLVLTLSESTDGFVVYCDMVRWLELLKDYDMSILYHTNKVNVVADALSRLSMGSMAQVEDVKKELVRESKQDLDPILVELKELVLKKSIEAFSQGGGGILRYQGGLCVPDVDGLEEQILEKAHSSRYSIHPGATKMYRDLREVYWWNDMKRDIAELLAK
ncbi:hypothetical protein MTR67_002568 [Solanum verrucosum]|uniref:Integrase zinc-binding domain-containing protein n=1 Tax=Solanum verrucosum TaxID=315347 RepID=A0AAF0PQR0_SOLVR|nr:hypothetical protein MTR67_002568 [Solanum verrucosum]